MLSALFVEVNGFSSFRKKFLVAACAAMTSAVNAFDSFVCFQFLLWHSANTSGGEIMVLKLHATKAAQPLVAWLLPLGDQIAIGIALSNAPLV